MHPAVLSPPKFLKTHILKCSIPDLFGIQVSGVRFRVSGTCSKLSARRLGSWEARKPKAMKFLNLQASKLPSLPAILLTPET
jgi:hypothetical protein